MRFSTILFIIITSFFSFISVYADTASDLYSTRVNNVVSKITDKAILSNYVSKLNTIEYKVVSTKQEKYTIIKNAIEKKYISINNVDISNTLDTYIYPTASTVSRIVYVNNDYEFTENGKTYRVRPYSIVKVKNDKDFLRTFNKVYDLTNEILMIRNGEYIVSIKGFTLDKKYTPDDLRSIAKLYIPTDVKDDGTGIKVFNSHGNNYILDTTYFSYANFPKKDFYKEDYSDIGDLSNLIIINGNTDFKILQKYELKDFPFSVNTRYTNQEALLANIASDYVHYSSGSEFYTNGSFNRLENITKSIVANKTTDESKIKAIYTWLQNNIEYDPETLNQLNARTLNTSDLLNSGLDITIFSGIGTYNTGFGVCQGYTKLFLYMLSIAGIKDVEIMNGYANNGDQYISHSWLRIGDKYYDPTFDDTIGNTTSEFIWYGLPKDIMYATRDYDESIDWNSSGADVLKEQFINRLTELKSKYNNEYPIFNFYGL